MPDRITNTGIVARNYNSRGLITNRADTKALVRQSDGTLWAALRENTPPELLTLYRSKDGGFSWEKVWSDSFAFSTGPSIGTNNTNGPYITLQAYEELDRLILWHTSWTSIGPKYVIGFQAFKLSDATIVSGTGPTIGADSYAVDVTHNDSRTWLVYTQASNLKLTQCRPLLSATTPATDSTLNGLFFDIFSSVAHRDGYVDIAILEEDPTSHVLRHVRWAPDAFSTRHVIHNPGAAVDITDVSIARDGWNNLGVVWSQSNITETDLDVWFSIGRSDGATWSAPIKIEKHVGHSVYTDPATTRLVGRSTILGGQQGFMLGYVHRNPDVVPKTFVRTLLTTDGITYELGEQKEIATQVAQASDKVVGLRWFRPPGTTLLDLSDPGQVRVAYQIGEGNSRVQDDTVPVRIGQEVLSESAYPSSLLSESGSYVTEGANAFQVPVHFNVLGAPNLNTDYFALGLVGHATGRYMAAFRKVGTELRFQRFEPDPLAEMDDRSAYDAPVEFTSLAVLDAQSYQLPIIGGTGAEGFQTFIERDVRRLYLPPDMHLSRKYILNRGNHLKRTVWVVSFDGNEYECTQVVPAFFDGVITHYSANAYVIGSSNDPFSRRVLPSET